MISGIAHTEKTSIFFDASIFTVAQNIVMSSQREKKYNLVWYNLLLPRVKKDSWMGYFLVWKAFISADFFFTTQKWGPLILVRYVIGTCIPKNKVNLKKKKKALFHDMAIFYN